MVRWGSKMKRVVMRFLVAGGLAVLIFGPAPAAPNAERADGPFATLAKARDALRTRRMQERAGFADPARGDYRLQPDSPALRLGFQPIDFDRIGPRH
jgi:hypothetical protein